jgi:hypothetical protein
MQNSHCWSQPGRLKDDRRHDAADDGERHRDPNAPEGHPAVLIE